MIHFLDSRIPRRMRAVVKEGAHQTSWFLDKRKLFRQYKFTMYYDTMKTKYQVFYPEFDVLIKKQRANNTKALLIDILTTDDLGSCSVAQNQNHRIASQEHLADETIFVYCLLVLSFRNLCPHLLHVFKNHVTMPVESLYSCQQFLVIS